MSLILFERFYELFYMNDYFCSEINVQCKA